MARPRGGGKKGWGAGSEGRSRSVATKTAQQGSSRRRAQRPAAGKPSPSPSQLPEATPGASAAADAAAAGRCSAEEAEEEAPAPVAAAKQRGRQRQSEAQQRAEAQQAHESIRGLADAAEAEEAAAREEAAAAADGDASAAAEEEEEEGAGCEDCEQPAGALIASAPGFKLARGQRPPCFRIWLSLQPPTCATEISGKRAAGGQPAWAPAPLSQAPQLLAQDGESWRNPGGRLDASSCVPSR